MRYKRSKTQLYIHIVWATHQRLPLVTPDIERPLYRCISEICQRNSCDVLAIGGMPDHVHLFVLLSPKTSISKLVKDVKGGSSHFVSMCLKPGEWFAWQNHYGAFSIALRDKDKIIHYILNQKRHHAEGSLYPDGEETDEDSDKDIPELTSFDPV